MTRLALLLLLAAPGCGASRLWDEGRGPWSPGAPVEARAWSIDQAPAGEWPAAWAWSDGEPGPDGGAQAPAWRPTGPCYAVERGGQVAVWTAGPDDGSGRALVGRRVRAAPLVPEDARPVALRPTGQGALILDDPTGRATPFAVPAAPAPPGASTAARLLFAPLAVLWDLVPAPLQRLLAPVLP